MDELQSNKGVNFDAFARHYSRRVEEMCCEYARSRNWTRAFKSPATNAVVALPDLPRAAAEVLRIFRSGGLGKFCLDVDYGRIDR
jgi:hypothetical protein